MSFPRLTWGLAVASFVGLAIGAYLLGHHRGYVAGRRTRLEDIPGDPWRRPPTEADFMSELLEAERRKPEIQKYPGPKDRR
jgi:hypothetical protein